MPMPDVKVMCHTWAVLSSLFDHTTMMIRNEHANVETKPLQEAKAPFCPFY